MGLFENPYKYCDAEREKETIGSKEIHDAALDMAKKSIVLLKNKNNILPLKKQGLNIALIGSLAKDKNSPLGSWRLAAKDNSAVSVLEGMQQYTGNTLEYAEGAKLNIKPTNFINEVEINSNDTSGFNKAKQIAKKADVVVMVLGEVGFQSGEGRSSTSLGLPGVQQQLLEEVFKVNQNIVLVLNNGRPLVLNWAEENIPSILEAWQLGSESGNAIAQVLYGDYNPSGKLPMSFPRAVGQIPIYYNYKNTGRPGPKSEVFWSHYQDEVNEPLYPFGYGLSYTTFKYSDLSTSVADKKIKVKVKLTNSGKVAGKEVVQVYIQDIVASVTRPVKELKGFELVELNPNETKEIEFILTDKELGFFNNSGDFIMEPGEFKVFVGGNSKELLETKIELK